MIVYMLISAHIIFPDTKEITIAKAREQMESNPQASEEMVDKVVAMAERSFTLFLILGTLFWDMLVGTIAALIGAAFAKKNPPSPFSNNP
jgi:hypothetical protein